MISYPFKATYELSPSFSKKRGKDVYKRLREYSVDINQGIKRSVCKKLFQLTPENFRSIQEFGHSDTKSLLFIEKRKFKVVMHLFSNSKFIFKEHMTCLEKKIISNPKGITRLIPATFYPIEYQNIYINNMGLNRIKRRNKIGSYISQSLMLYISPLLVIFYKNLLSWEIPDIDFTKSISLLIIYTIILIYNIIKILGDKHAIKF